MPLPILPRSPGRAPKPKRLRPVSVAFCKSMRAIGAIPCPPTPGQD